MQVSMAGSESQSAVAFVSREDGYLPVGDPLCDAVLGALGPPPPLTGSAAASGRALPLACSVSSFGVARRALSVFRCAWAYPDHAALDARDGGCLRYPHSSSAQQLL